MSKGYDYDYTWSWALFFLTTRTHQKKREIPHELLKGDTPQYPNIYVHLFYNTQIDFANYLLFYKRAAEKSDKPVQEAVSRPRLL